MTARRETFLATRTSCPACGAPRLSEMDAPGEVHFACGLGVELRSRLGEFAAIAPCRTRSTRLVRHWNQQTAEKTKGGE